MEKMAPQDAAFFNGESRETPMHVSGMQIMRKPKDAPPDYVGRLAEFMRGFKPNRKPFDRILAYQKPAMARRNSKPEMFWGKPDHVNMEEHVYLWGLPYPGGEHELVELVARIHVSLLDRSKPLWEFHLIDGLSDNRFAIYARNHHSLIDGVRGRELFNFSLTPDVTDTPPVWYQPKSEEKSEKSDKTSSRAISPFLQISERLSKTVTNAKAMPEIVGFFRESLSDEKEDPDLFGPMSAPRTIINGALTWRREVAIAKLPFDRFKNLAKAAGVTFNDVFLAVCSGALRSHLKDLGKLPDESLIGSMPLAVEAKGGAGNAFAAIIATLATDQKDPAKRLMTIARSTAAAKKQIYDLSPEARDLYSMLVMVTQPMFSKELPIKLPESKKVNANIVVSNVPGPRNKLYINGAEVLAVHPISLLSAHTGLNVTMFTYGDYAGFGFVSCPDLFPGLESFAARFEPEFEALEKAVLKKVAASEPVTKEPADKPPVEPAMTAKKVKKAPAKRAGAKKRVAKKATTAGKRKAK